MKKLSLIFIVVILLFSGCGSNNFRDVELTDFEYNSSKIDNSSIITINIIPKIDIKNLNVYYRFKNYAGTIEKNTIGCGDLKSGMTYSFSLNSKPNGYTERSFEIFSATGKVDKNSVAIERDAEIQDIIYNNEVAIDNEGLFFVVTPKVYINNCSITFSLTAERKGLYSTDTKNSSLTFTKRLSDVVAGNEYRIEVPNYEIDKGYIIKSVYVGKVEGEVKK